MASVVQFLAWLAQWLGLYQAGILLTTLATLAFLLVQPWLPRPFQRIGGWVCWLPLAAAAALMTWGSSQTISIYMLLTQQDALSAGQSKRLLQGMVFGWGSGLFWGLLAAFCVRCCYARFRGGAQTRSSAASSTREATSTEGAG